MPTIFRNRGLNNAACLYAGVSVTALALMLAAHQARAAGECGAEAPGADTVICTGASFPNGITYAGSDGLNLTLNDPAMTVLKGTATDGVRLSGTTGNDLIVTAASLTSIDGGTGTAVTVSNGGDGKAVLTLDVGALTANSAKTVFVTHASGSGDSVVTIAGGIATNIFNATSYTLDVENTASATGNATILVTGGTVKTNGASSSVAMRAVISNAASSGTASVTMTGGAMTGSGIGAQAVTNGSGLAQVILDGASIASAGNTGAQATNSGSGNAIITVNNSSVASGIVLLASGLNASANSGTASVTVGNSTITAKGVSGSGIAASSSSGAATVAMTGGSVSNTAAAGVGLRASSGGTGAASVVLNGGTVGTTGATNAHGVYAVATDGRATVEMTDGTVTTAGLLSTGLRAQSANGLSIIRMTGGTVTTNGTGVLATNNNAGMGSYDISITGGTVTGGGVAAVQGYSTAPGGVIYIGPDAIINAAAGASGVAIATTGVTAAAGTLTTAGTITGQIKFEPGTANTLNITGGSVAGDIVGGGDDILTFDLGNGSFTYDAAYNVTGVTSLVMKSGTATLANTITTDAVTVTGGTLILTGAINAPAFALNGGTLSVSDDSNLGTGIGALNFNGGILQVTGSTINAPTRSFTWGANGGGFDIADAGNVFTVSQALTGGPLTKLGDGTLLLTADNTYSGGTIIGGGTLQIGDGGTTGSIQGDVVDNGALVFNRAGTLTFAGAITGTGDVTQQGAGTTIFTGHSDYRGGLYINQGVLQVANGGVVNIDAANSGTSLVDVETDLIVTGAGSGFTTGNDFVVGRGAGTNTVTVDQGAHLTTGRSFLGEAFQSTASAITIVLNGAGSVWNAGGFLQLAGATGGTATLTVSNGGVMMTNPGGGAEIGRGGDGVMLVTGAGSQLLAGGLTVGEMFNGAGAGHGQLTVSNGGAVKVEAGGFSQIGAGGEGIVLVTGPGSQLLAGDSLYVGVSGGAVGDGQLTIQDGGLVTASLVALSYNDGISIGNTGTLTVLGTAGGRGVLETASLSKGYDAATTTFDGGVLRASASAADFLFSYGGDFVTIGAGGMFLDTNGFNVTASSGLAGAGALTKQGTGTLTLTAANGYAGGTLIEAGVLQLGDGGANGAILGDVADNGALAFNRSDTVTFAGIISGSGAVIQSGGGATILTANNTYSGGTTISGGTLRVGNGGATGSITGNVTDNGALAFNRADMVTFTGIISGSGSVIQAGGGNLTMTGVNSYSGGTTIAMGTLTGTAASFGSGAIIDNAALVIDQATDAAFANAVNGTGSFTKQGAGRLNYTGTGGLSGATAVAAGTLSVNGSLMNSAVTVWNGATLGGNGTVGATIVQSGGTIAPGNSIGTLHVAGGYTQAAGSVYQVQLDPNSGASDLITASGTAALQSGAGLSAAKDRPGAYRLGTTYTVLHADGGVGGTYTLSGDTQASPYLALRDSYDANNVYLSVVQTTDPAAAAQTGNQQQTASGVDSLPGSGDVASGVLNTQNPAETRDAFDQLSGEALASAGGMLISGSVLVRDTTFDRLRDMLCDAVATDRRRTDCGSTRATVWAQGFGDWSQVYGTANAARVSQTTGGFLLGVDVPVAGWRLGFFGGHSRSDFDVVARNSAGSGDSDHLGLYGGTTWDDLGLRLGASYSWNHLTMARHVAFDDFANDLRAHYGAGTAQVFGEVGQAFALDAFTVEPFASLAYVNLRTDGFSETGGAAALTSRASTMEDTFATFGVRPRAVIALGSVDLVARGMLGWRHTFGSVTPQSVVAFAGGSAFTVTGAPIARDAGVVEAGLNANLSDGASIGLTYGGQFSDRASDNSIRGTLAVRF